MAVSSTTNRVSYAGNGVTTAFSVTFPFQVNSDVKVIQKVNSTGVETTKAETTNYTLSGTTLTMLVAPPTGTSLIIYRDPAQTQGLDLADNDKFPAEEVEKAFDKQTYIAQRLNELLGRAVKLPDGYTATFSPALPPVITPLAMLAFNAAGDGFTNGPTATEVSNAQTYATNALASQVAAAASQSAAATSASGAATSASGASTSATNAATSATNAAASATAANTSKNNAATSETNAASSASAASGFATTASSAASSSSTNAATASSGASTATTQAGIATTQAGNAATSATAAASSAAAAATSATAAQTAAAATMFRDVVFKTFADSPITLVQADQGKLFAIDTSGGNVVVNLPTIAGLSLATAFSYGIKKTSSDGNSITINRTSTDTIDGATSKVITTPNAGATFVPDTDPSPDVWTSIEFGATAGNLTVDVFSGTGAQTAFTLSVSPGSKANTQVFIEGVYQQQSTYSLSGTTLTFSTAPPTGTSNIEVKSGTTLSIGVPSDATVTNAKMTTMPANTIKGNNTGSAATPVDLTISQLAALFTGPTLQTFLSGSGTYTKPANCKWIRVRAVGGGGGGGGSGSSSTNGGAGGNTTFGGTVVVANGAAASSGGAPGAGGTASLGTGAVGIALSGAQGQGGGSNTVNGSNTMGPMGASSPFGGAGGGGQAGVGGRDALANTGSGGGGGTAFNRTNCVFGAGGSAGGYCDAIIAAPSASYAYAVGAGGAGGASGGDSAGGAGAVGMIIVEEYYH